MGVCGIRGFDFGENMITGRASSAGTNGMSTNGMYSSDIGKLVVRSTDSQFLLAIGTTATRTTGFNSTAGKLVGYLAGLEASPSGVGTTGYKVYINKFSPEKEYEVDYSTLYSTVLPGATDIGKVIGLGNTTTIAGCVVSMGTLATAAIGAASTTPKLFQLTGFDNNRRKVYVRPILDSGEFER